MNEPLRQDLERLRAKVQRFHNRVESKLGIIMPLLQTDLESTFGPAPEGTQLKREIIESSWQDVIWTFQEVEMALQDVQRDLQEYPIT